MDRWLFTFFTGSILSLFMPIVPAFFYVLLCLFVGIVCLFSKRTKITSGIFIGAAWILYSAFQYQHSWEENDLDFSILSEEKLFIKGTINTIPALKANTKNMNYKFNFIVEEVNGKTLIQPIAIRLNWNKSPVSLLQGDEWFLHVKLKLPHGFSNTGGFSYQTWLRQNKIVATGYVKKHKNNTKLKASNSIRQNLYLKAVEQVPEHSLSPVLLALSFGERSQITPNLWKVLQQTNTQHLIAISGLHLGLIATGSFLLFTYIFSKIPINNGSQRLQLSYLMNKNHKIIAISLSCLLALYYAYLAGFSLPTLRALVMLFIFWGTRLLAIQWSLVRWLLVSVFIVIVITPFSLISASFWLSFYAVSLIFLTMWRFKRAFTGNNKMLTWLKSLVGVQLCLSIFMLPLSMLFNYQISTVSVLANLIAVPFMSVTAIPLCLLAVVVMPINESVSLFLYKIALWSVEYLWLWLSYLSSQSWALVEVSFQLVILLSSVIAIISGSLFLSFPKRYLIAFCSFIICAVLYFKRESQDQFLWQVTVLDVGHGLSVIIEKNDKAILYDTGARYPSGFNMVESVVLPYLKHKGITSLDKVLISHSDNDHAGGLPILRKSVNVSEVVGNDIKLNADKKCMKGDVFVWQELTFSTLWPENNSQYVGDENDDSCVVKVSDGNNSVLLTGDISMSIEKKLIADVETLSQLKSNLLVAPHHGSNTSSSDLFIQAVSSEYVIFSTGANNRWNMPSKLVQKRYENHKIKSFNTAKSGSVEVTFRKITDNSENNQTKTNKENKANEMKVHTYRQNKWPFWFAN